MSLLARPEVQRLVEAPLLGRLLAGRVVAGPRVEDGLRALAGLVAEGHAVALEHRPGAEDDAAAELAAVIPGLQRAAPGGDRTLTLPVDRLADAREPATAARAAGLGIVLEGRTDRVAELLAELPEARVVVDTGERDAEARCRALGGERVRLRPGRGADALRAFARCVDVLMAGDGRPAVATVDRRLIAITGERAAWYGRPSDSWEHVMPWGIRTAEQQRLAAAGTPVRVAVASGRGAVAALPELCR